MTAFLFLAAIAAAQATPMPAFLAGCWEVRQTDDRWTEECWTDARGTVMLGAGRTGQGDTVRNWEWMRIERGADGGLTFFASTNGAPAVGFKAVASDGKSITFLNAGHDHPQRVKYVATADGLEAETSLADGSKPSRWSYRRTAGGPRN